MPTPNAITAAQQFRQQLLNREAQAAERMAIIYARIFSSLSDDVEALAERIALDIEAGKYNKEDAVRLTRLKAIVAQVAEQAQRFGNTVQDEIAIIRAQAIEQAIDDAITLMRLSLPDLPDEAVRAIVSSFIRLPADAIEAAAGLLVEDSALTGALSTAYGEYVAGQVEDHLLDGIAAGRNPRQVAFLLNRNLQQALGSGLSSALTTIRTAQIKSYQLANHAQFQANPEIVPEWTWVAALDDRTCMSCVNNHGKTFPITETLRDHHNGRCVPVPKTISYRSLGINLPDPVDDFEPGESWFNRQPEVTQRAMMGPSKHDAYKAGAFQFDDLSMPYDDDVYGELIREASLKDILGRRAKEFYVNG